MIRVYCRVRVADAESSFRLEADVVHLVVVGGNAELSETVESLVHFHWWSHCVGNTKSFGSN